LAEGLSPRDRAILATLRGLRLASGDQLGRLHFQGASLRERRRVLASLALRRLVVRLDRRVGGVRAGSAGHIYALDVAGQRLTDRTGPAHGYRVRRPWTPGLLLTRHTLAITELDVRLVEAERRGELGLHGFVAEPQSWRRFLGRGGGPVTLKPDAALRLRVGPHDDHWFIEVDCGTESPLTLARKCDLYRAYWSSGQEQARHGVFPRVLFTVPTPARHAVVVDVLGRQPAEAWPLFTVCLFDEAVERLRAGAA
jgi:hypothetical protein